MLLTEALAALIEAGKTPLTLSELGSRFGQVSVLFASKGWLTPGPPAGHVQCRLCDRCHDSEIVRRGTQFGYWCLETGAWGDVDDKERETRTLQFEVVRNAIRSALQPIDFSIMEQVPGTLWSLGESQLGGRAWTPLLARRLSAQNLAKVLARLPEVSVAPALVMSTTPLPPLVSTVAGFRFRAFSELFRLNGEGDLKPNVNAIKAALRAPPLSRKSPGRPPDFEPEALAAVDELTHEELAKDDDAIVELVVSRVPGLKEKNNGKLSPTLRGSLLESVNARRALL